MGWQLIANFNGTLEGNSYMIKNLYINRPNDHEVGLFGYTQFDAQPIIGNLKLIDVDITGLEYVGALIGSAMNQATVSDFEAI